jgi:hypothetical protein
MKKEFLGEKDKAVRCAREKAFSYLHNVNLRNPGLNGEKYTQRNVTETIRQELNLNDDGLDEYRKEHPDLYAVSFVSDSEKEIHNKAKLLNALEAFEKLGNHEVAILSAEELDAIKSSLANVAELITGNFLPEASDVEIHRRNDYLRDAAKITRAISAAKYPNLDPGAGEYTPDESHHTRNILRYLSESATVNTLALQEFLSGINDVNAAFAGKMSGRNPA